MVIFGKISIRYLQKEETTNSWRDCLGWDVLGFEFSIRKLDVRWYALKPDTSAASSTTTTVLTCFETCIDYIGSPRNGTKETADKERLNGDIYLYKYRDKREPTTTICVRTNDENECRARKS